MCVAVGREHLKDAVLDAQDGNIERPAAEIVDRNHTRMAPVEAVRQRRGRWFVDDAEDVETRNATRVARRGALRIVEIRGHSDDRAVDLGVRLALLGEERFSAMLQFPEDERRDLGRREFSFAESDADDAPARRGALARDGTCLGLHPAADAERELPRLAADVVQTLAHETLDGVPRAIALGEQPPLRFTTDVNRS